MGCNSTQPTSTGTTLHVNKTKQHIKWSCLFICFFSSKPAERGGKVPNSFLTCINASKCHRRTLLSEKLSKCFSLTKMDCSFFVLFCFVLTVLLWFCLFQGYLEVKQTLPCFLLKEILVEVIITHLWWAAGGHLFTAEKNIHKVSISVKCNEKHKAKPPRVLLSRPLKISGCFNVHSFK